MKKSLSSFTIAATYVGTVVGAGFASGQEVLQFFGFFGIWGLIGIAIATALFIFFGNVIMQIGHNLGARSHEPVIREVGGRGISSIIDWTITFFLFGVVVTMAAGSGAIFVEQFGRAAFWGSLLMVVLPAITVLLGVNRVIESISLVAPILLLSVLSLGLWTVFSNLAGFTGNLSLFNTTGAAIPNWPASAVLYVSYNIVLAVAVLAPLGALSRPEKIRSGAVLGGLGLGLGVLAIASAIIALAPQVGGLEVPMIAIAGGVSPLVRTLYSIVLIAEVYTTAVAGLYGFAARLAEPESRNYKLLTVGTAAGGFVLAQFGFSTLVGTLFPAVGFAGLLLLGALTYYYFRPSLAEGRWFQPGPARKPDAHNEKRKNEEERKK